MSVNGNMRPVESIPGMGGSRVKNDGGGEFNYDVRSFVNASMYSHLAQQLNK
jgi:hypothetical protein